MTTTFQVDPVTPSPVPLAKAASPIEDFAKLNKIHPAKVEAMGVNSLYLVAGFGENLENGFVRAVHMAYDKHYPLSFTPDDVWLVILQGCSKHIAANAKGYHGLFSSAPPGEKRHIEVSTPDSFVKGDPYSDWGVVLRSFEAALGQAVGPNFARLQGGFSTTGGVEAAVATVAIMDAMSPFYTYGMTTCCGIPSVTLEGTAEDWQALYGKAEALVKGLLCFDAWWAILEPTLSAFVTSVSNQPDMAFWQDFYKKHGGSGGPYISGKILALFPYMNGGYGKSYLADHVTEGMGAIREGMGGYTTDNFPGGFSKVDVRWNYHGAIFPMQFWGGFAGVGVKEKALAPAQGWYLVNADS